MRSKTSKIFAWIIVVILVVGLAGFGIQDVLRTSGKNDVIRFADQKVTTEDYVRAIQLEIRNLSNRLGTPLSFEQANSFGASQMALQKLLTAAVLDQAAEDLKISRSDKALKSSLKANSAFWGVNGKFDPARYKLILQNMNLSPEAYEQILRKEMSRKLVLDLLNSEVIAPEDSIELIFNFINEERSFDMLTLTKKNLEFEIDVTETEVRDYYETSKDQFMQPVSKDISYVFLSFEDLIPKQNVSEQEINDEFLSRKADIDSPEKREIQQIFFQAEVDATVALEKSVTEVTAFNSLIVDRKLSDNDINLGEVTSDLLPTKAAQEIFSTSKTGVYGPYETDVGFVLYNVINVIPAISKTIDEEYESIKGELASYKAEDYLNELITHVNGKILEGFSLEEIANSTEMNFGNLKFFEGSELPSFARTNMFETAVNSATSLESDLVLDSANNIFSVRLDKETQPFLKKFEDVKASARDKAHKKKLRLELNNKANSIIESTNNKDITLADFSKSSGFQVEKNKTMTRFDATDSLPDDFAEKVFSLDINSVISIQNKEKVHLVQLKNIFLKDLNLEETKKIKNDIRDRLSQSLSADISNALINSFIENHELVVSQKAIDATIGRFK